MVVDFIESEEDYMGFVLKVRKYRYTEQKGIIWHRKSELYKNGERIAVSKTKKELKEMIKSGCFK